MQSSSYLKSITKGLFNPSSIIFYGLCGSLLSVTLSISIHYDSSYKNFCQYILILIFSSKASLKFFRPYFEIKRIKTSLSLPISRKDYYENYTKPYILLVITLLLSTILSCLVFPTNMFNLLEMCGIFIFLLSLGFSTSIESVNLSTLEGFSLLIRVSILLAIAVIIISYIKFNLGLIGSIYVLLLSLLYIIYSIISTKKKFLKQCY